MSDAIAFDTHKFVKHLTEKGFAEEQAEALAIEQINLLNGNLTTKTEKPCGKKPRPLSKGSRPTC